MGVAGKMRQADGKRMVNREIYERENEEEKCILYTADNAGKQEVASGRVRRVGVRFIVHENETEWRNERN